MGCDIHSMVEVKKKRYEGRQEHVSGLPWTFGTGTERWVGMVGEDNAIFPNSYYDPDSSYGPFREKLRADPLDDRNYTLFALLADVRNGRGFAGIVTGDRIQPLAEPRGVPTDASYEWLAEVDSWDIDGHSHTWFTLAELVDHPLFNQRLVRTGAITGREYERIQKEGGMPSGWSGSVSGAGIRTVTPQEYDAGERGEPFSQEQVDAMQIAWRAGGAERGESIESVDKRLADYIAEGRTYVQYVWEDSLPESIGELTAAIEALKRYAADMAPAGMLDHKGEPIGDEPGWYGHGVIPYENIRIVMFFDN